MAWDLRRINNLYASEATQRSDYAIVKNPEYALGKVKGSHVTFDWWEKGRTEPLEPLPASELRRIDHLRRPLKKGPRWVGGGGSSVPRISRSRATDPWRNQGAAQTLSPSRTLPGSFRHALIQATTTSDGKGKTWCPEDLHAFDPLLSGSSNLLSSAGAMRHYTKLAENIQTVARQIQKAPHRTSEFLDERGCEEVLQQMRDFETAASKRRKQKLARAQSATWYRGYSTGMCGCQPPIRR